MSRLSRIANAVMLVLFVSWACFQYNDPDPLIWILVYGLAAVGCLLVFLDRFPTSVAWAYVAACTAGASYLVVRIISGHEFIFDEQGREMMGLLISAGWIGFLILKSRNTRARAV